MEKVKKRVLCDHTRQAKLNSLFFAYVFILPFLNQKHNKTKEEEIINMRTRFTKEVDTYDKFEEVCWNCSKSYLAYFILLANEDGGFSDCVDIACHAFSERFLKQTSGMVVQ